MNQQRIIEYRIVYSDNHRDFVNTINKYIKHDYQPYGDTFMANDTINNESCYHQPMVKYELIKYESNKLKEPRWKTWKREKEFAKRNTREIIQLDNIVLRKTKSY